MTSHICFGSICKISGTHICYYNPKALHPFDAMKVILEQSIFVDYLTKVCGESTSITEVKRNTINYFTWLPRIISTEDAALNQFYVKGIDIVNGILLGGRVDYAYLASDLTAIFNTPNKGEYHSGEYVTTINKPFLDEWLACIAASNNLIEIDKFLPVCCPSIIKYTNNVIDANDYNNTVNPRTAEDHLAIEILPVLSAPFKVDMHKNIKYFTEKCGDTSLDYLSCFNLHDLAVDDLIGVLSNFSIDHDRYAMTYNNFRLPDVCFDLVTGSHYCCRVDAGTENTTDMYNSAKEGLVSFIKQMLDEDKLKPLEEYRLFGELLERMGDSSSLVNYFNKQINTILATEAAAFRSSDYATIVADRFDTCVGMEAVDPLDTDTSDSTNESENDNNDGTDDNDFAADTADDDAGASDSASSEISTDDSGDQAEQEKKPPIDPQAMLLEMAKPNGSMNDFVYRETVSRRISSLLKNPPENANANDLLMLKRFNNRWLFLVSVACIRDFLTRVSLRLS